MLQTAIIAKRVDEGDPDTEEIRELTEAADAQVVGEVTQVRPADPGTCLGSGKVEELAKLVDETGADTVVIDEAVTPQQTVNLEEEVRARVVDRHRVVLEIFAQQARTRRAQLQVELARLNYRLPRVRARSDEGMLNRRTESGTPYYDLLDRIDELERKLKELPAVGEQQRQKRREQGFDLVAIAGYTNAGKSTLLRRLADEMSLDEETHDDIETSASAEDRLFKTLETTTRRATIEGRDVLLTDTVGFLDDLPHWLVESFRGTLREVEEADAVLLVVDAAQPAAELTRKLETSIETFGESPPPVVPVLNKADLVDEKELERKREAVAGVLARHGLDETVDPVETSAIEGKGLDELRGRLAARLPELERERLELPLSDDAMSLASWLHDEAAEIDVEYGSERAVVEFAAKPTTIEKARTRVSELGERSGRS